ncbi:HAD family hydrolase [Streptomyces yaizuensis]|uniref:HAD family phosphatase n=1 Tax=Streptomyces yaizuensis TaxID=2989713 RepID=A0ABQ5NZF3_9ACTN|nr:HAD family phosphatase [Streptomyces sp. YSPA8]GLF95744.1 HAD family phosphatase [Streptomyces sp. YSPA8]
MSRTLDRLRLAALNIDGVLLNDTFSPVIHDFVVRRGGSYTAETERSIFSRPRRIAGRNLAAAVPQSLTGDEALAAYFTERDAYLTDHPVRILDGAVDLVRRLRALGLRTVCYGGLPAAHFDRFLGEWAHLFDGPRYVCTDDFRPGLREITVDHFGLEHGEALFVDDVALVAEAARGLGAPFIGQPSGFVHGFQRQLMTEAGVRHLVDAPEAIDEALIRAVDAEAALGTVWDRALPR